MINWFKILLIILGLGGTFFYWLYFTDFFVLREIRVTSKQISKEEIIKLTGLKGGERLFRLNLREIRDKIKNHPWVEDCTIFRKIPSTLDIFIKERVALGILIRNNKGYLMDKKGFLLREIYPQDYLFYPVVEFKNEEWKERAIAFLEWIKHNKNYLPVYENLAKISLEKERLVLETKQEIKIYFPLTMMEEWIFLYKALDKIMVYLYENKLEERVELIRLDYPYGRALIKFRG